MPMGEANEVLLGCDPVRCASILRSPGQSLQVIVSVPVMIGERGKDDHLHPRADEVLAEEIGFADAAERRNRLS